MKKQPKNTIEVEIISDREAMDVTVNFRSTEPLDFDDLISALKKVYKQEQAIAAKQMGLC